MFEVFETVDRALKDPTFGAILAGKAAAASKVNPGDDAANLPAEWNDLLKEFATRPGDLARMRARIATTEADGGTTTTITTTGTLTTAPCLFTTTTTTTTTTG